MLPEEVARVSIFIAFVVAVYAAAVCYIGSAIRRRVLRGAAPVLSERPLARWLRRLVLALAALGTVCIAYGRLVEPYWLEVTRVRIESPKLPPGTRPIRLAHISDLHSDSSPRLERRLPGVIAREMPDLIVFTGDTANSAQGVPVFRECLSRLARVAPTFAVKGNWDTSAWARLDRFGGTGARELNGEAQDLEVAGARLCIAGAAAGDAEGVRKALAAASREAFTVFLHHYADPVERAAEERVDLYCAGHTHGGQVALPLYGALITLSRFGKRYEAGLYRVRETWLYVNRGIGMEGGAFPRVRFCARPEVTVIEIAPLRD